MTSNRRPEKTAALTAQRILDELIRSGKTAGDRLPPEKEMVDLYGIGRGTLRESLRILEHQGILSIKPGPQGGPIVEEPSGDGLATSLTLLLQFERAPYRTIIEARQALEPEIASLAATRLTSDQLSRLRDNVQEMGENVADERRFLELNEEFHDLIATGSGNALFEHLIGALIGILDGRSAGIDYPKHRRTAITAAHTSILEAIEAKDPEAAAAAMYKHIEAYSTFITKKFPGLADNPIVWGRIR